MLLRAFSWRATTPGTHRKDAAENSLIAYKAASDIALTELPPTHPIRLGLALNFSVFYFEILNSPDRACHLAKQVCSLVAWRFFSLSLSFFFFFFFFFFVTAPPSAEMARSLTRSYLHANRLV